VFITFQNGCCKEKSLGSNKCALEVAHHLTALLLSNQEKVFFKNSNAFTHHSKNEKGDNRASTVLSTEGSLRHEMR
jgi:hypothetical protein